ncbi:peptide synthetase [Candidatus Vecturithrix granuli]|uniref:Peptide synthetase n=1 Tax=Vecturithrix granuli TaxID=1499967 RepID=A0A0S6W621_VECG1|nr:peptide synthetase [Candidatus Vecturithrix granuli]
MEKYDQFCCFLIGEGSLPVQCGNLLLECKHGICGMISPDATVRQWAEQRKIPCYAPTDDLVHILGKQPFDYLFSIVNSTVIPANALKLPRRYAINYHNAPLPKYAGTNVASHAIMHQEKFHGVTWHVMTESVDAGDILKQHTFPIGAHETALSLNTKCYEAALHLFGELVEELACGRIHPIQQNLTERTYFGRYQRPPAACLLDWNQEAQVIDAMVRGLTFGNYPNPLGLPKMLVGKTCLAVAALEVTDIPSQNPPGTITMITPEILTIATGTFDVNICQITRLDGHPLSVVECAEQFDLRVKDVLPLPSVDLSRRLTEIHAQICRHESFWIKCLETLQPMPLPYSIHLANPSATGHIECITMNVPAPADSDFFLAACITYFARLNNLYQGDIAFCYPELRQKLDGLEPFFAMYVPFHLHLDDTQSLCVNQQAIYTEISRVKTRQTYMRDLVARFPSLHSKTELRAQAILPVAVEVFEGENLLSVSSDAYLTLRIKGNGAVCHWIYKTGWLKPDDVARMAHYFETFVSALLAQPEQPLACVPLLTPKEQHQILYEWNATQAEYPHTSCLHQIFEAQVRKTPEAIAVVYEDAQLTYRELNQRANQLAHYLRKSGVGPEVLVGLCLERSLEMIVGLLGILKAGGAYVPFNPEDPKERLAFMLEDTQASILLTQQALLAHIPEQRVQVICIDTHWKTISRENENDPENSTLPQNIAYVIYTSGSTGIPKGVVIQHQSVLNLWNGLAHSIYAQKIRDLLRISLNGPLTFDTSVKQWVQLLSGHTLYVIPARMRFHGNALLNYLQQHKIDVFDCTPSQLKLLLEVGMSKDAPGKVLVAGEMIEDATWQELAPQTVTTFYNLYGPTECTVDTTVCQISAVSHTPTIGRPLSNIQVYILDPSCQPVPVGISGELYIGGVGLARGYLKRADTTAEKFVPHPFSSQPGARMYKTGDLARYLPDGNIEFLGRSDHQVKIRGFRIEPGEIETIISENPLVQDAVVLVREDIPGDKRLVAYVIPAQGEHPTSRELRNALTEKLPGYMIPAAFIQVERFPLTPNGKIDRRAFPPPDWSQRQGKYDIVAPRTSTERILAEIWTEVLEIEHISIDDNFFEIGGHSLSGMRILSRLQAILHISLPLHTLFESPTVESLARAVDAVHWAIQHQQEPSSPADNEREVVVL